MPKGVRCCSMDCPSDSWNKQGVNPRQQSVLWCSSAWGTIRGTMRKKQIRCFRGKALGAADLFEDVFFTFSDFGYDIRLYSCLNCGALCTASGEDEHYSGVCLANQMEHLSCPDCAAPLAKNLQPYPQSFLASDGTISHFDPGRKYPPDSESLVKDVWNLYSESDRAAR